MKCAMCNRTLNAPAASVPTRGGPLAYGPKCAARAGLLTKLKRDRACRQRARALTQPAQQEVDPNQIALEFHQ